MSNLIYIKTRYIGHGCEAITVDKLLDNNKIHREIIMQVKDDQCSDDLRVYLGLEPYQNHINRGSTYYLNWLITRYGQDKVEKCLEELSNEGS